jgi:hypothetical protein
LGAEAEPGRQREHDLQVGARLAARRLDRPSQLHERLGVLTDLEPDPQRLGLERGGDGKDDVGQVRRRAEEDVERNSRMGELQ